MRKLILTLLLFLPALSYAEEIKTFYQPPLTKAVFVYGKLQYSQVPAIYYVKVNGIYYEVDYKTYIKARKIFSYP